MLNGKANFQNKQSLVLLQEHLTDVSDLQLKGYINDENSSTCFRNH